MPSNLWSGLNLTNKSVLGDIWTAGQLELEDPDGKLKMNDNGGAPSTSFLGPPLHWEHYQSQSMARLYIGT